MALNWILQAFVVVVFTLGFIIAFHEFCHLIAAKIFGVKVTKYSIGFGKALFGKKIGETQYVISMIPLGGYVKPLSEEELQASGKVLDPKDSKRTLESKPRWQQIIIIAAGSIGNFILGTVLFFFLAFILGFYSPTLKIDTISDNSPARNAGLQSQDLILFLDGQKVKNWEYLTKQIQGGGGKILEMTVLRDDQELSLLIKPQYQEVETARGRNMIWIIGIVPKFETKRLGFSEALKVSVVMTGSFISMQFDFFQKVFRKLKEKVVGSFYKIKNFLLSHNTNHENSPEYLDELRDAKAPSQKEADEGLLKDLAGPLGIAQIIYKSFQDSWRSFLFVVAMLNIGIGFANLLPIYPFDGGRILFLFIEIIIRRPISLGVKEFTQSVNIVLFLGLLILVTINDYARISG